jgi:peptidoglycan/LPS O-acetylase OafA/YrhL
MRYVPGLDGVRALAVLMVILFHFGYLPAGWVGVQLFFVLSGFLITSILLVDKSLPFPAYVTRFYWRRSLRIFPLYFAGLAIVAIIWWGFASPRSFADDWLYLVTYTANFGRVRPEDLGPAFVHAWSLSVEEQFYLVWPFVVYLLPRRIFRNTVIALLLLAPLSRAVLFAGLLQAGNSVEYAGRLTYVLPFTQLDAFAAGAAIPLFGLGRLRHAGRLLLLAVGVTAAMGMANALVSHFFRGGVFIWALGYQMYLTQGLQYVWGYSLLNLVALLLVVCTLQRVPVLRWLEARPLVEVGKRSYGIYVYHLPLLVLLEWVAGRQGWRLHGSARASFFVGFVALVLATAFVSYRFLEAPFLRLKDRFSARAPNAMKPTQQPTEALAG